MFEDGIYVHRSLLTIVVIDNQALEYSFYSDDYGDYEVHRENEIVSLDGISSLEDMFVEVCNLHWIPNDDEIIFYNIDNIDFELQDFPLADVNNPDSNSGFYSFRDPQNTPIIDFWISKGYLSQP